MVKFRGQCRVIYQVFKFLHILSISLYYQNGEVAAGH